MSKHRFHFALVIMILVATATIVACKKGENEDCKTCKALNTNGSVAAEQKVCSDSEQSAFYSANAGKEIVCN